MAAEKKGFDPRERLKRFQRGVKRLDEELPAAIRPLFGFIDAAQAAGVLTVREKELIAIGVSLYSRCEDCVVVHARKAPEAGCTRPEILEAAGMAMVFGGGPSLGASASLLLGCLDEFEKDFAR
jgi:AhpD family alkylhydroperoxidase